MLTPWGRDKMTDIFAEDIIIRIFLNEIYFILIRISLKFVPNGKISNRQALIMAWCQTGDKPWPEPMMV